MKYQFWKSKFTSVSSRLTLLAVLATVGLLAVGGIGWLGIVSVSDALRDTAENHMPAIRVVESMRATVTRLRLLSVESTSWGMEFDANDKYAAQAKLKQKYLAQLASEQEIYERFPKSEAESVAWQDLKTALIEWGAIETKINAGIESMAKLESDSEMAAMQASLKIIINKGQLKPQERVEKALDALVKLRIDSSLQAQGAASAQSGEAKNAMIIAVLLVGGLVIVLNWLIVRAIVIPLRKMRETIVYIGHNKDLTHRLSSQSQDETGQTIRALDELLTELQSAFRQVLESAAIIAETASNATQAADRVAKSSSAQSEAAAEMAASVEEMTVSIANVTDSAHDALQRAKVVGTDATESTTIINQGAKGMMTISQAVGEAGETIDSLGQQTKQINTIMAVIKEVADQTNLLALNAAIEAARAGEQGRGFAVVADEVRKLAERTGRSTQEINAMVSGMQLSAGIAVDRMKAVVTQVNDGATLSGLATSRMEGISESAQRVVGAVNEISDSLSEQNTTAHDIARRIEQIANMTEENSNAAAETSSVARTLDGLAADLRTISGQFKV